MATDNLQPPCQKSAKVESFCLPNFQNTSLSSWFVEQAAQRYGKADKVFLLAHADDGVIWGRIENGQLKLAGNFFPEVTVELRLLTLQQARLFNPQGELFIWRGANNNEWCGRFLCDADGNKEDLIDECHHLWGTASEPPGSKDGFTLMRDGQQGLLHAPPISLKRDERAGLQVRHYIDYDEQGQAYIALSRLVDVVKL